MSLSKPRKITPVLPPDQWRKLKCRLSDKQLFWNCRGCKYICGFLFFFFFYKKDFFENIFKKKLILSIWSFFTLVFFCFFFCSTNSS